MLESKCGRRGFIAGLVSLIAAPAIVRAASLMPVYTMPVLPPIKTDLDLWNEMVKAGLRRDPYLRYGGQRPTLEPPDIALRELADRHVAECGRPEDYVDLEVSWGDSFCPIDPGQPPRSYGQIPGSVHSYDAYGWDWVAEQDYSAPHPASVTPIFALRPAHPRTTTPPKR